MLATKTTDAADVVRQMELAAYMTHCALEPAHLMLALNLAMVVTFKHQNFIHAAGFARRILELPDITSARNATLAAKVRQGAAGVARGASRGGVVKGAPQGGRRERGHPSLCKRAP